MSSADISQSFNDAVDAHDWGQIVLLGERSIAEGDATHAVLYNLGLAYLQKNEPALAMAVLLAIPRRARDENVDIALANALAMSGLDRSELDYGSHGLRALAVDLAESVAPVPVQLISALSLPMFIITIVLSSRITKASKSLSSKVFGRFVLSVMCLSIVALVVSLGLGWFSTVYRGYSCAIVSSGANLRLQPKDDAVVIRDLQVASPILATSDPQEKWVHVLQSSGASGWVESIKMRCVDEPK